MDSRERQINEMGETAFGNPNSTAAATPWFNPLGVFGKWWTRYFATKAQPAVAQQSTNEPTPIHPMAGDTIVNPEVVYQRPGASPTIIRQPFIPELEMNRKNRYSQFESMDEYPEVGAAFDIYADDCTQRDTHNRRWAVAANSQITIKKVEKLFETIKLDRYYWDITRNMVKYGDCFIELVMDLNNPKAGIQRVKILNPNYLIRVENEYGYLTDFLQEIPQKNMGSWNSFGYQSTTMEKSSYIGLDKNQLVHFRLHTSDPKYYPYGKSIAAFAIRVFRSLKLMEDAMLIYRLSRAPERRIFYVNVGSLPTGKAEAFMEKLKQKFKKEKFFDSQTGNINEKLNPMSLDEDYFVPHRGNNETKIETLPGAQNLDKVDDVKYFRDKLLACLKIPKDYVVETDKSPERKANLSQLDVKFARVIMRVQHEVEIGLETIAKRHLAILGLPQSEINSVKINLPDPSDMFTKRRLDVDEQKLRVVQAAKGLALFSDSYIYKEYFEMTEKEIKQMKDELEEQQAQMMEQQMQQQAAMQPPMPGGAPPPPGAAGGEMPPDGSMPPNGIEGQENMPPTAPPQESLDLLQDIKNQSILNENIGKALVFDRIIKKYNTKLKNIDK
jgi:hypothetical protein